LRNACRVIDSAYRMGILLLAVVPNTPLWQLVVFACNLFAFIALFSRILLARLAGSYPALVVWLIFNIVGSIIPWVVPMDTRSYYWFYIWAEGASLVLYLLVVVELYGKVLKRLPGVASTMKAFIEIVVPVCALSSLLLVGLERHPHLYLEELQRAERTVITSLFLFVLLITAFMVWFPIRVVRNTVVYSIGYAVYLVPKGAALFLANVGFGDARTVGAIGMTVSTLCLLFWTLAVNRTGEGVLVSLHGGFRQEDESHLVGYLEEMNRSVRRFGRTQE